MKVRRRFAREDFTITAPAALQPAAAAWAGLLSSLVVCWGWWWPGPQWAGRGRGHTPGMDRKLDRQIHSQIDSQIDSQIKVDLTRYSPRGGPPARLARLTPEDMEGQDQSEADTAVVKTNQKLNWELEHFCCTKYTGWLEQLNFTFSFKHFSFPKFQDI